VAAKVKRNQANKPKMKAARVKLGDPHKAGAPSAYTKRTVQLLCAAYSTGVSLKDAAAAAGISYRTVFSWREESERDPKGPKGDFCAQLEEALSKHLVQLAHRKGQMDPGWMLARLRPQRFGDPARKLEVAVDTGAGANEAIRFARELLTNDAARDHLEAAGRLLFASVAVESGDVRTEAEPGTLEE
jgi:hypothetical protein